MTFFEPDLEAFPLLALAFRAISLGGGVPAVLNAANEIAVEAFLKERIGFTDITDVVSETVSALERAKSANTLEGRIGFDREAREYARALIAQK